MSGHTSSPTHVLNSAIARWYCAPPNSRICALGSDSATGSALPSGATNAPARNARLLFTCRFWHTEVTSWTERHHDLSGGRCADDVSAGEAFSCCSRSITVDDGGPYTGDGQPIYVEAPPRMCSSASVSPKRSGGAATVPRSSSASFWMNASRKMRPCNTVRRHHAQQPDPRFCMNIVALRMLLACSAVSTLTKATVHGNSESHNPSPLTFSLRRSGARSVSSSCVAVRRCAALRYSFSSSGTIAGTFSRYLPRAGFNF